MSDLLPGANSPQMLTRLLEAVARGIRTPRALQEALALSAQTVRAYVVAAGWLGFVVGSDPVELSPLGVEYVFAGPRRAQVYARAVWAVPLAAELLVAADGRLPEPRAIEAAIAGGEPGLAEATIERRAGAVRSLLAPAIGRPRPRAREQDELQLGLPLGHAPYQERAPALDRATHEHDPDAYRYVLGALLDHGELSPGHLRALLDRAGAGELPIGGLLQMATERGDAVRSQDRLVVTAGAVERKDLVAATPSTMLSDPQYRAYLADSVEAVTDRRAAIRRDAVALKFRAWDRRLFGRPLVPERVEQDLERVLLDRPLSAFPVAGGRPTPLVHADGPFLDVWEQAGLTIALPPTLAQLQGGLPAVNRLLRASRTRGDVGIPDLAYRPIAVHGGILHPDEPIPRAVPDARTLRHRVLMHAPFVSVLGAALLLHRHHPERLAIQHDRAGWAVKPSGRRAVPLLRWIDGFGAARGWVVSRRDSGGLPASVLVSALEATGVAQVVGRLLVLAEPLFARLGSEPEEMEILGRLRPLAEAVDAHLSAPSDAG